MIDIEPGLADFDDIPRNPDDGLEHRHPPIRAIPPQVEWETLWCD